MNGQGKGKKDNEIAADLMIGSNFLIVKLLMNSA
jgi:hypothetical protein